MGALDEIGDDDVVADALAAVLARIAAHRGEVEPRSPPADAPATSLIVVLVVVEILAADIVDVHQHRPRRWPLARARPARRSGRSAVRRRSAASAILWPSGICSRAATARSGPASTRLSPAAMSRSATPTLSPRASTTILAHRSHALTALTSRGTPVCRIICEQRCPIGACARRGSAAGSGSTAGRSAPCTACRDSRRRSCSSRSISIHSL